LGERKVEIREPGWTSRLCWSVAAMTGDPARRTISRVAAQPSSVDQKSSQSLVRSRHLIVGEEENPHKIRGSEENVCSRVEGGGCVGRKEATGF
jgi:hypothetical protein